MSETLHQMFGVRNPVITMAHFAALSGKSHDDATCGMDGIDDSMRQDTYHLSQGGEDAFFIFEPMAGPDLSSLKEAKDALGDESLRCSTPSSVSWTPTF